MPFDLIGSACFVCESDQYFGEIGRLKTSDCPRCSPTIALNLTQGQRVLDHIGAHILFDAAVINSQSPLCGLCLRPSPLCQMFLSKGKGGNRNLQIDQKLSRGCLMKVKYSYSTAAKSTPSSPCSNVPVQCPICPKFSLHVHISVTTQTSQKSRKTGILTTMIPAIPSQSLMKMGRTHAWRDTTAMGKLQVAIITTWKEYREIY